MNVGGLNSARYPGAQIHHAFISQELMEKYPALEVFGNSLWNLKSFNSARSHGFWAHKGGYKPALKNFWTLRYQFGATPDWYRGLILSSGGRFYDYSLYGKNE